MSFGSEVVVTSLKSSLNRCGCADTEAVVIVSSAMSKNGVFYVMPAMMSDTAHLLTRINDIIRL